MKENAITGVIGVSATWGGAAVALFSQATIVLSFFSVLVGLVIGCLTLWRMWNNPPKQ